jgi:hypothetical protein
LPRRTHKPEVSGSIPLPATNKINTSEVTD